jgi:hypothetical protein
MSNTIQVSGQLNDLSGENGFGPFSILSTGSLLPKVPVVGTSTVPVPASAQVGVAVLVESATSTVKLKTVSGDTGIEINPASGLGALLVWDPANIPADVYVVCSNSEDVLALQFF